MGTFARSNLLRYLPSEKTSEARSHRSARPTGQRGPLSLEDQFQTKLNLPGIGSRARGAARRRADVAAGKDVRIRDAEVCDVGDVEEFGPKF